MGSGDPMLQTKVRMAAMATTALSVLALASCGVREPVDAGPPVEQPGYGAAKTPDLMGAPPVAESKDGLLGGPVHPETTQAAGPRPLLTTTNPHFKTWRRADGTLVTAMAPIPNPKEKRRAVRYAPRAASGAAHRPHVVPAVAKPAMVAAAKPAPVIKPAPVVKTPPAPAPKAVAPAPAPLKPVVAATPVAPLAKAPTPVVTAPAKPLTKVEALQAAIAPEATKGAVLAAGDSLAQGKEGQVTLSLPSTLGDMIKAQAAKLGLGKPAKKASAYANLEGQGYEITPNGKQTAVIKPGEAPTFAWQVKPTPAAKGQLKSEFGVELNGTKPAQTFSLGTILKQVGPVEEKVKAAAKGFKLPFALPKLGGFDDVDMPMIGKVPAKTVLGGGLVLLALLILVIISRSASASKAREERRRKFRTLTDYGRNEMEFDADAPKTEHVNYVNPMVAAAGVADAGAAISHAHDDHGHDAHAHDDHAHDGHGHDAHAADGHAEAGHDDHHDDHHAPAAAHDDHHGHPVAAASMATPVLTPVSHDHDHGHAHGDDHGHDAPGHGDAHAEAGHEDHCHEAHDDHHAPSAHGHDDHPDHHGHHVSYPAGASPEVLTVSHDAPAAHHDDHGHDHEDHGHAKPDDHAHGDHGHDDHGHDDHGHAAHDDHHGHPVAAKELDHAH